MVANVSKKIAVSLLDKHIILGNFNLYHPVLGDIETKSTSGAKSFLAIVEQYGLHLLLKTYTITYDKGGYQSIIDLIFVSINVQVPYYLQSF